MISQESQNSNVLSQNHFDSELGLRSERALTYVSYACELQVGLSGGNYD